MILHTISTGLLCLVLPLAPAVAEPTLELTTEVVRGGDGKQIELEQGSLEVPENRRKKESRSISIAFIRARSTLEKPGSPVFLIAGGPGGSSIAMVRGMIRGGGRWFLDLLGGDVIGVDQRGVGESQPNLTSSTVYGFSPEEPGDRDKMLLRILEVCRKEAEHWRSQGVDLSGYNTAESADDLDAVRRALGYEKISLWGGSYGSHLALATIRRHELHVDRALLIGPEGPDHTIKLPSYTQEGLELVAEKIRQHPSLGKEIPDFVGTVKTILDRLEREPVYVEIDGRKVGVSKFDVQRSLANAIGIVHRSLVEVPAMITDMARGDFKAFARELMTSRPREGIRSAMQMVMDGASGLSEERRKQIENEKGNCLLEDAVNFPFPDAAHAWSIEDLGEEFRGPLRSEVPILFVVGDLDSRTPIRNAKELMTTLPNAHLIEVENAGHDTNVLQPELRRAWHDFFAGRAVETQRVVAPPVKFHSLD